MIGGEAHRFPPHRFSPGDVALHAVVVYDLPENGPVEGDPRFITAYLGVIENIDGPPGDMFIKLRQFVSIGARRDDGSAAAEEYDYDFKWRPIPREDLAYRVRANSREGWTARTGRGAHYYIEYKGANEVIPVVLSEKEVPKGMKSLFSYYLLWLGHIGTGEVSDSLPIELAGGVVDGINHSDLPGAEESLRVGALTAMHLLLGQPDSSSS